MVHSKGSQKCKKIYNCKIDIVYEQVAIDPSIVWYLWFNFLVKSAQTKMKIGVSYFIYKEYYSSFVVLIIVNYHWLMRELLSLTSCYERSKYNFFNDSCGLWRYRSLPKIVLYLVNPVGVGLLNLFLIFLSCTLNILEFIPDTHP